jgi:N-acetylmuramoyl-L-alanine amidase
VIARLTFPQIVLALPLLTFAVPARAESEAQRRIERAKEKEAALLADEKKLRMRHNIESLHQAWASAVKAAEGAERVEALEGEARALSTLARWSGLESDKQRAKEANERLADAKKKGDPQRKKELDSRTAFLTKIDLEVSDRGVEIALPGGAQVKARSERIPPRDGKPARIYFDLSPMIAAAEALKSAAIDHPAVARLRVGQRDERTVRFVFEMPPGKQVPETAELVTGPSPRIRLASGAEVAKSDPKQVLEELTAAMAEAEPEGKKREIDPKDREALERIVAEIGEEDPPSPAKKPEPEQGRGSIIKVRRILIDAGHGGKDTGAIGKRGTKEKDVNLAIALALGKALEERLGVAVSYTRTKDSFVSLDKRVQIANASSADLLISVHSNAHKNSKLSGVETYYLNTTSSRYASRLAQRENAEHFDEAHLDAPDPDANDQDEGEGELPGGALGRDIRLLLADLAMRSATADSRRLAGLVQSSVVSGLRRTHADVRDLGVKHALFYVLLGARMPSVLIETGFLSHTDEEKRLSDAKVQQQIAQSIAVGVEHFIQHRNQIASRL